MEKGLNDEWIAAGFTDVYTTAQQADPSFGAVEGWLPLYGDADNEYPWVHWDEVNCPLSTQSFAVLPGANRDQALVQIDTMAGYFGVRACLTLGLDCTSLTNTKEVVLDEKIVTMAPNPTNGSIRLETNYGRTIKEVVIHSLDGKLISRYANSSNVFQRDQLNLLPGFYSVLVRFEDGVISKKLVVN